MNRKYIFFVEQLYSFAILRPIQAEIERRGDSVAWFLYQISSDNLLPDELQLSSEQEVFDYVPDAILCPGNWLPAYWPGSKVQVFHGFGIEKKGHFRIRGFFDLYCTHGPITTDWFAMESVKRKFFRVVETGWPKLDPVVDLIDERKVLGSPITVLYAPTFSKSLTSTSVLHSKIIEISKTGGYKFIVKFHPIQDNETVLRYVESQNENLVISDSHDLLSLLSVADIVLTDTSSVVVESLFLRKPVITFNTKVPGPHTYNFTDSTQLFSSLVTVTENYMARKTAGDDYLEQMHPYQDGKSSERVLDAIEDHVDQGILSLKPAPKNWLRDYKVKRRMKRFF